ncbi:HalOD1 output domain-containing protein [Haloarcula marina]|uniref:HalOD1 output domain-containing protein n=1 Tax=Haloarcula marina TaxID=2961574 RepID=UPI0020B7BBC5|nr:HalOD1 output domain-containing protein [Halomicroarcula marina]
MNEYHRPGNVESTSLRIVEAVADTLGSDPCTLNPPLGTVVDPDALDSLVESGGETGVEVTFTYADCRVSLKQGDLVVQTLGETNQ